MPFRWSRLTVHSMRAVLAAGWLCAAMPGRAAEPDALEKSVADQLRPFYAEALHRAGSTLEPNSPAWEASLARSASAFLAARPDDCALDAWLAATCGARSLVTPSRAMEPALDVGDFFFSIPLAEGRPLRRGEVITFRDPHVADAATATIYVSRLIGLPGDTISLHGGLVTINGTAVPREPTGKTFKSDEDTAAMSSFTEHLPDGRSYDILRPADPDPAAPVAAVQDDMPEIVVPPGHYFMLGDNRLNAMDSRFASLGEGPGLPATTDILGRASLIYVSRDPSRIGRHP